MKKLIFSFIALLVTVSLTTCNMFGPSSKNTPKNPAEEEWPSDLPPEEVRLDENGQPMHRIPIVLRKSDELIARLTAAQEQARGLDVEVAQLCINWFEVVVRDSEAAGNYYFASGTSHPDLPKENTILYLWLPNNFTTNAGYWNGNVMCYGGYRRRADDGVGYDQTLLAIGECTHIDEIPMNTTGGNVTGATTSLTFLMNPLEFDIKAREHPNFFYAIGARPAAFPGTLNNPPSSGGGNPPFLPTAAWPPSATIGTPPAVVSPNPIWGDWLAWLANYRSYNAVFTNADDFDAPNMANLPAGAFWIQTPGRGTDAREYSTVYQGNYHTWVSRELTPGGGNRVVVPYFEIPSNNDYAKAGTRAKNYINDGPIPAPHNQFDADQSLAIMARMWINGILVSKWLPGPRPYTGAQNPDGQAITNSLQAFLDFTHLKDSYDTTDGKENPRLLSTNRDIVDGYVMSDDAGGSNWNYQFDKLGFYVGLMTKAQKGWALVSCNFPIRPVPYDEVNLNNPNNQHEVWYIRNGMYLTTPDYGIADGSLGGGILLRVVDEPNESFVGYPPLPDFIPTRYLPDPDYPGNPPIPTMR